MNEFLLEVRIPKFKIGFLYPTYYTLSLSFFYIRTLPSLLPVRTQNGCFTYFLPTTFASLYASVAGTLFRNLPPCMPSSTSRDFL